MEEIEKNNICGKRARYSSYLHNNNNIINYYDVGKDLNILSKMNKILANKDSFISSIKSLPHKKRKLCNNIIECNNNNNNNNKKEPSIRDKNEIKKSHSNNKNKWYCCMYTIKDEYNNIDNINNDSNKMKIIINNICSNFTRNTKKNDKISKIKPIELLLSIEMYCNVMWKILEKYKIYPKHIINSSNIDTEELKIHRDMLSRPNRTFLRVTKDPIEELKYLNELGNFKSKNMYLSHNQEDFKSKENIKLTSLSLNSISMHKNHDNNNNDDNINKSNYHHITSNIKKKHGKNMQNYELAFAVENFKNKNEAEVFCKLLNDKSRGRIPRTSFCISLAKKWNFTCYINFESVLGIDIKHHSLSCNNKDILVCNNNE